MTFLTKQLSMWGKCLSSCATAFRHLGVPPGGCALPFQIAGRDSEGEPPFKNGIPWTSLDSAMWMFDFMNKMLISSLKLKWNVWQVHKSDDKDNVKIGQRLINMFVPFCSTSIAYLLWIRQDLLNDTPFHLILFNASPLDRCRCICLGEFSHWLKRLTKCKAHCRAWKCEALIGIIQLFP